MTSGRMAGAVSARFFGALADGTSLLPPKWRYAYVHPILRRLFSSRVYSLPPLTHPKAAPSVADTAVHATDMVCAIVADRLDVGGIGTVVEMLVSRMPQYGIRPVIVCVGDGPRAMRLRAGGIEVISVRPDETQATALQGIDADVVQMHSAPPLLEKSAIQAGLPLIPVLHNTEIHYTQPQWDRFETLLAHSSTAVAVSRVVADFHARHVPACLRDRFVVVPNGAPNPGPPDAEARRVARGHLADGLGGVLGEDDVVFVCLARYDAQKNNAGTVAGFIRAVEQTDVPMRLVLAGDPSDWVEYRRADGMRRESRSAGRVHLFGNSDAEALLSAADAFLLNSFFEGWPMAATEAMGVGLPLVLSDVGGARELIARDPARSVLVSNATGAADEVTDARVAAQRRRSGHQRNAQELADAIMTVAEGVVRRREDETDDGTTIADVGLDAMAAAHAGVLRAAVRN
ncbi:glycosyltransferase [Microbacterium sp.]|uniref:glycosyltransferase n=1 Tax=Microbacterium sp. TaxID=51671 RepID=UPI003A921E4E